MDLYGNVKQLLEYDDDNNVIVKCSMERGG